LAQTAFLLYRLSIRRFCTLPPAESAPRFVERAYKIFIFPSVPGGSPEKHLAKCGFGGIIFGVLLHERGGT
jgi:hypothetical protein